jgi:Xaa-Pro dipeptidase
MGLQFLFSRRIIASILLTSKQFLIGKPNIVPRAHAIHTMLSTSCDRTLHRNRLIESFSSEKSTHSVIYLKGTQHSLRIPTSDVDQTFRQESNFFWATGCNEADCAAVINLTNGELILLIPERDDDYALWCGEYPVEEDYKKTLGANRIVYNSADNLKHLLAELGVKNLFTLKNCENCVKEIIGSNVNVDGTRLYGILRDLRMIKTQDEVEEMRKICKIAADAHVQVMRHAKPGMYEYELESVFIHNTQKRGARNLAYQVIAAGDDRGATLHYVNNDKIIHDGGLFLIDAGAESPFLYASDITRTFPVNGKFTKEQREIYEIVLEANKTVIQNMKPGVSWVDMHRLADRIITQGLLNLGFLVGPLQELLDNHLGGYFFPHGLGHSIGLDVHDPPNRDGSFQPINEPGIQALRVHCILKEGIALTVEPGLYFVPRLLRKVLADQNLAKYLNREKVEKFFSFGGVRIEDNVVVTKDGVEVLTKDVPKEIDDLEKIIGTA